MGFTASESRWNDANSGGPPLGVGVAVSIFGSIISLTKTTEPDGRN